jgi:hypothetical protein
MKCFTYSRRLHCNMRFCGNTRNLVTAYRITGIPVSLVKLSSGTRFVCSVSWKEAPMACTCSVPPALTLGTEESHEEPHLNQYPGRYSNQAPSEFEFRALPLRQPARCSGMDPGITFPFLFGTPLQCARGGRKFE